MSLLYEFDDVRRLAAGAVGEPGQRTFYIQVDADDAVLSVKCEKQQVAVIAMHIRNLLADLPEPAGPSPSADFVSDPTLADFVLGTVGIGYDRSGGRIFLQFDEMAFDPDAEGGEFAARELFRDDDEPGAGHSHPSQSESDALFDDPRDDDAPDADRIRMFLSPAQALAFCEAADSAVSGGRAPCRWCGAPIDPHGHVCPRLN